MIGANTLLVLDIGRHDCKVAQYALKGSDIRLTKRDIFTPTEGYMTDDRLIHINEFVTDIVQFFKISGFMAKKIMICGSVLDITSTLQEWAFEDPKELPKMYEEKISKPLSNLKSATWQFYGTEIKENATLAKLITSEVKTEAITALTNAFAEQGYQVTSVTDDIVATFNLIKLSQDTFERPSRFILNLGSRITAYSVVKNNPMDKFQLNCSFAGLIKMLCQQLGITEEVATYALFNAGFVYDKISEAHLSHVGINMDEYFAIIVEFGSTLAKDMKQAVDQKANSYKIGQYRLMLIGGYSTVPGIEEALSSVFQCETIELADLIAEGFEFLGGSITSAPGQELSSGYLTTLGCVLGMQYKIRCNLVNANKQILDITTFAKYVPPMAAVILGGMLLINSFGMATTWGKLQDIKKKSEEITSLTAKVNQYTIGIKTMDSNLSIMDNISDLIPRLVEFIDEFDNSKLLVASVDSESILRPVVVSNAEGGEVVEEAAPTATPTPSDGGAGTGEGGAAAVAGAEAGEDGLTADAISKFTQAKQYYYIRGYSRDYTTAIQFFDKLGATEFIEDISLSGIDKIVLPSEEDLYLFEIIVRG